MHCCRQVEESGQYVVLDVVEVRVLEVVEEEVLEVVDEVVEELELGPVWH
jgi:hypothetical protein